MYACVCVCRAWIHCPYILEETFLYHKREQKEQSLTLGSGLQLNLQLSQQLKRRSIRPETVNSNSKFWSFGMWFLFLFFASLIRLWIKGGWNWVVRGEGDISDNQYCKYKTVAIRTGGIYYCHVCIVRFFFLFHFITIIILVLIMTTILLLLLAYCCSVLFAWRFITVKHFGASLCFLLIVFVGGSGVGWVGSVFGRLWFRGNSTSPQSN